MPFKANNMKENKTQELTKKLYLATKKSNFECRRKKVIGKPCEGELHARFDEEGLVKSKEETSPLFYPIFH